MENGIDWGSPMGVALSSGQSMLPAVLCGAVHRDAVTLVIDKPSEEKNILQSCSDISLSGGI